MNREYVVKFPFDGFSSIVLSSLTKIELIFNHEINFSYFEESLCSVNVHPS
jgi:hypothetical protein